MRDRRMTRDERGATLIITAMFFIVAALMLAFVVDLGLERSEVKQTTLSTDAAALAAASAIDFSDPQASGSGVDCALVDSTDPNHSTVQDLVDGYWAVNAGQGAPACTIYFHATAPRTAYVTVEGTNTVEYSLAGVTGVESSEVRGTSSALVASAAGGNLYPVGMCGAEANDALGGDDSVVYDPPQPISFVFSNAECGGSGNFRQVQFDPSRTGDECGGEGMWCYDFKNGGYPGAPQFVESDTGTNWQRAEEGIVPLVEDGTHIWIVAVEYDSGSGTGAIYEVTHFVEVVITGYYGNRGLDFDVYQIVPYDPAGPPALTNADPVPAHLCATSDEVSGCEYAYSAPRGEGPGDIDLEECEIQSVTGPATITYKTSPAGQRGRLTAPFTVSAQTNSHESCSGAVGLRIFAPNGDVVTDSTGTTFTYSGNDSYWDDRPGTNATVQVLLRGEVDYVAAIAVEPA